MGTTGSMKRVRTLELVHPHARGDNAFARSDNVAPFGSPPRPWGQLRFAYPQSICARFTPTPVGTTSQFSSMLLSKSVHPHARGDNLGLPIPKAFAHGSPPRPWGQRNILDISTLSQRFTPTPVGTTQAEHIDIRRERFTPTPVGTTSIPLFPSTIHSVHPHARGDNAYCASNHIA